ncbi:hypothetical protein GCM10010341_64430 [Streptomyces noursei]|nr:hypothetical protein GCM10010341_64430 [Streptomyces noursei]
MRERHAALGGELAGQCLDLGGLHRSERGRAAAAFTIPESGQSRLGKPAPPSAHSVDVQPCLPRDTRVGATAPGMQNHLNLGAHP